VPRTTITLDQALDLTRTGDVWLFRGRSGADRAIRSLTNAPVTTSAWRSWSTTSRP
jgi:hypothetical protein